MQLPLVSASNRWRSDGVTKVTTAVVAAAPALLVDIGVLHTRGSNRDERHDAIAVRQSSVTVVRNFDDASRRTIPRYIAVTDIAGRTVAK
jgi:hypothetical protein